MGRLCLRQSLFNYYLSEFISGRSQALANFRTISRTSLYSHAVDESNSHYRAQTFTRYGASWCVPPRTPTPTPTASHSNHSLSQTESVRNETDRNGYWGSPGYTLYARRRHKCFRSMHAMFPACLLACKSVCVCVGVQRGWSRTADFIKVVDKSVFMAAGPDVLLALSVGKAVALFNAIALYGVSVCVCVR